MKSYQIEIKWGLLFVAMGIFWLMGERLVGLHDELIAQHPTYTNLIAIPAILLYVLGLREKRDKFYGGKMTWGQGFKSGMIISLIVVLLTPISQWITSTIISPAYFTNAIAYSVDSGNTTLEEAEAFFNYQNYVIMGIIGALVMGAVTSAIVALFVRKS